MSTLPPVDEFLVDTWKLHDDARDAGLNVTDLSEVLRRLESKISTDPAGVDVARAHANLVAAQMRDAFEAVTR